MPVVWSPLSCSPRRFASTILPSPVQNRVLVRLAPMGQARDRGRRADCHRPQEWGYGSVHAATRARFKGFAASRTRAPPRQFPPSSSRGDADESYRVARRLPDHAARPAPVGPIPQTRSDSTKEGMLGGICCAVRSSRHLPWITHQARRCEVNPAKVCGWTWSGPSFIPK